MTLSKEDGKLYYEIWFPLLDYVNENHIKLGRDILGHKTAAHAESRIDAV